MYYFKRDYQIMYATIDEIWEALTDEKSMEDWNGENVSIDEDWKSGLRMEFDGVRIWAENISLRRPKFIHQKWEFIDDDWNFASIVTLRFSEFSRGVFIQVLHEQIPDERREEIEKLWRKGIIEELQGYFREKHTEKESKKVERV